MREIKCESDGPLCLTKCPYLYNIKVGSACCTHCIFHSHHDDNNNIVFCRFRELSQRKEEEEEITEVKKYEKIPQSEVVEAIQFTKDCPKNLIINFLINTAFGLQYNSLEIKQVEYKVDRIIEHSKYAKWGDWIVKENDDYNIFTNEEFKKRYKEI
jgi:hypothetical protein